MTSNTSTSVDNITASLDKWKLNATKEGGRATRGRNGVMTPEATPAPDTERNKADEKRRQENTSKEAQGDEDSFSTSKEQHPGPNDNDTEDEDSTGEETDIIQEVLKCGNDEHRKILRIEESYEDPYLEEKAVLDAFWERGEEAHPKNNQHKNAEKAYKSKLPTSIRL